MATWPSSLKINKENFRETPQNNVLRSDMDVGPAKIRKRSSLNVRSVSFSLFLTDAELETLDAFYLANDALSFDFVHPRTDATVSARFVQPPEYSLNETMWSVSVALEVLP